MWWLAADELAADNVSGVQQHFGKSYSGLWERCCCSADWEPEEEPEAPDDDEDEDA